jgi:hypothetical protein
MPTQLNANTALRNAMFIAAADPHPMARMHGTMCTCSCRGWCFVCLPDLQYILWMHSEVLVVVLNLTTVVCNPWGLGAALACSGGPCKPAMLQETDWDESRALTGRCAAVHSRNNTSIRAMHAVSMQHNHSAAAAETSQPTMAEYFNQTPAVQVGLYCQLST